jgi:hypothetical protein
MPAVSVLVFFIISLAQISLRFGTLRYDRDAVS